MRGKRGRGERRLEEALAALRDGLEAAGAPWMIIGGIAVIAHGVRRMTTDVDAVVRGDAVKVDSLIKALGGEGIAPRIKEARAFAERNLVLLLRHAPTGVDLDLSLGWTGFEQDALEARTEAAFGGVTLPMVVPEDLVVFKAMAARPKDVEDASALLALHPTIDLDRVRAKLAELATLVDAPELIEGLEEMLVRSRGAGSGRKPRRTPRRSR